MSRFVLFPPPSQKRNPRARGRPNRDNSRARPLIETGTSVPRTTSLRAKWCTLGDRFTFACMQAWLPGPPFRLAATGWRAWVRRRWVGLALTLIGLSLVGYLAYASAQPTRQSPTDASFVAVLAALANVFAAFAFARVGTVTPTHARSAVARLLRVARTLTTRYTRMTEAIQNGSDRIVATEARVMNAEVFTAILTLSDAINDWNEVHGEALAEVLRDAQ